MKTSDRMQERSSGYSATSLAGAGFTLLLLAIDAVSFVSFLPFSGLVPMCNLSYHFTGTESRLWSFLSGWPNVDLVVPPFERSTTAPAWTGWMSELYGSSSRVEGM